MRRLLEHQKYQGRGRAAARARDAAQRRSGCVPTAASRRSRARTYEPEIEVDLFSLIAAFQAVLERAKPRPTVDAAVRADPDRRPDRAAAGAAVGNRGVRLRGSVPDVWSTRRRDRDVPGAAGDDPAEAGARVPVRRVRADPGLQVRDGRRGSEAIRWDMTEQDDEVSRQRAARSRAADGRKPTGRPTVQARAGQPEPVGPDRDRGTGTVSDELKAIIEALIFASPEPLTPKVALQAARHRAARGRRRPRSTRCSGTTRTAAADSSWSRWPAAIRSSRAPSCTSGCVGCSTSARRRSCRCRRSRRWPSSPTSSRSRRPRSPRFAA